MLDNQSGHVGPSERPCWSNVSPHYRKVLKQIKTEQERARERVLTRPALVHLALCLFTSRQADGVINQARYTIVRNHHTHTHVLIVSIASLQGTAGTRVGLDEK